MILIAHVFGVVMGYGAALSADALFFGFLRKGQISEQEVPILRRLSGVVWTALILIVLSGLGLFLPASEYYLASSKFLAKMTIVAVIIVNGALLHFVVTPKLTQLFSPTLPRSMRRLTFALGAVSATSWFSAFLLGMFPSLALPLGTILGMYVVFVVVGISGSQFMERFVFPARHKI